jgi:hypothetical protein
MSGARAGGDGFQGGFESIGRALQLSADERLHLLRLWSPEYSAVSPSPESVKPEWQNIINQMAYPAFIANDRTEVLAWNRAACEIVAVFHSMSYQERVLMKDIFHGPVFPQSYDELGRVWAIFRGGLPFFFWNVMQVTFGLQKQPSVWRRNPPNSTPQSHCIGVRGVLSKFIKGLKSHHLSGSRAKCSYEDLSIWGLSIQ